jgi:hypothetical protein
MNSYKFQLTLHYTPCLLDFFGDFILYLLCDIPLFSIFGFCIVFCATYIIYDSVLNFVAFIYYIILDYYSVLCHIYLIISYIARKLYTGNKRKQAFRPHSTESACSRKSPIARTASIEYIPNFLSLLFHSAFVE